VIEQTPVRYGVRSCHSPHRTTTHAVLPSKALTGRLQGKTLVSLDPTRCGYYLLPSLPGVIYSPPDVAAVAVTRGCHLRLTYYRDENAGPHAAAETLPLFSAHYLRAVAVDGLKHLPPHAFVAVAHDVVVAWFFCNALFSRSQVLWVARRGNSLSFTCVMPHDLTRCDI